MRRTSVSLPTTKVAYDPHEKAGRYSSTGAQESAAGILEKAKSAWMGQSPRARYLKTGGILLFVVFLFYYLSPSAADVYSGGTSRNIVVVIDVVPLLTYTRRQGNGEDGIRRKQ